MRLSYLFAILGIVLNAVSPMAQEIMPADQPAASEWPGPIVGGHHRQPTEAEVEARQRAEGESATAIQERNREEEKAIDDLNKTLLAPIPSGEQSREHGQLTQ